MKGRIQKALNWFDGLTLGKKAMAIILTALFFLALIPLLQLSVYTRPVLDDFSYSCNTARTWRETGSLLQVLSTAADEVVYINQTWQGTFSAIFLFSLQPGIFSDRLYFLTTLIMLGALSAGTAYFLHAVFVRCLGADRWTWLTITMVLLLLSTQCLPYANQAFFWYNGSVYYTFFYGIELILLALALKLPRSEKRGTFVRRSILLCLLAVFVSGGNYSSALLTCVLLLGFAVRGLLRRTRGRGVMCAAFILSLGGLSVSVLAPGNDTRAALNTGMPVLTAVLKSFVNGAQLIGSFSTLMVLAGMLLLLPLFWTSAGACPLGFRRPLLAAVVTFCLFSAQLTPSLYAMSNIGGERQADLYYYSFLLLLTLNVFYGTGWLRRRLERGRDEEKVNPRGWSAAFLLLIAMVAGMGVLTATFSSITTLSAISSLRSGQARAYAREMDERIALYQDDSLADVVVKPITDMPDLFVSDGLLTDPKYWTNNVIGSYYDKNSVVVEADADQ